MEAAESKESEAESKKQHLQPIAAVTADNEDKSGEHEGGGVETEAHYSASAEWGLVGIAVAVALAGWGIARQMYMAQPELPAAIAARAGPIYTMIREKYYVDELYELVVLRPFYALCRAFHSLDVWVVDGAVNGARHATCAQLAALDLVEDGDVHVLRCLGPCEELAATEHAPRGQRLEH